MNLPIQDIIDEDLRLAQAGRKSHGDYWYASSIGYCARKQFFDRAGLKGEEKDARTLRVFEVGKLDEGFLLDRMCQKIGKKYGELEIVKAEREVECNNPLLNVHGRIDLIVHYADGTKEIVETKSQSSRSFTYMVQKGEGPNPHHLAQLWFYLYTSGINNGQLCYLSKDDLRVMQYPLSVASEVGQVVLERINKLNELWAAKKLPKADEGWLCKYCDHKENCKKIKTFNQIKKCQ